MTAVIFGMRLRVKGESQEENVKNLLSTLPEITSTSQSLRLHFDRGYGKMQLVCFIAGSRYDIATIASTLGSRHPFILNSDLDAQEKRWNNLKTKNKLTQLQIDNAKKLIKPWVLNGSALNGSSARVAKKILDVNGKKSTIFATAIRDCYDKKAPIKDIRFFSSGSNVEKRSNVWVALKKKIVLPTNTLFVTDDDSDDSDDEEDNVDNSDDEDDGGGRDEGGHDDEDDDDGSDKDEDVSETNQSDKQKLVEARKEMNSVCLRPSSVSRCGETSSVD